MARALRNRVRDPPAVLPKRLAREPTWLQQRRICSLLL